MATVSRDQLAAAKEALIELSTLVDNAVCQLPDPGVQYDGFGGHRSDAEIRSGLWTERLRRLTFLVDYIGARLGTSPDQARKAVAIELLDKLERSAHRGDPFKLAIDDLKKAFSA